jgi:hypothetical protein
MVSTPWMRCIQRRLFRSICWRLIRGRRTIVVTQNTQSRTNHVVELAAIRHIEEDTDGDKYDADAEGNQKIERFHDITIL